MPKHVLIVLVLYRTCVINKFCKRLGRKEIGNILVAMPASVIAGTLLTSSFLQINDPVVQWGLGLLAGGGVAGTIQAGTSLLRLGSTKLTGGLGNNILTSIENGLSVFISLISLMIPVFVGILVIYFIFRIWRILYRQKKRTK